MSQTLLLADDSVTIQRVIELTFADENIQVVTVGDGQQAIDRIKSDPPDIVLADTGMPECDGYDIATFVKADPALAHIPVVLLTGAFEPVDGDRARLAGCDGVLVKPFEPQAVIGRVRALLGGRVEASSESSAVAEGPEAPAEPVPEPAEETSGRPMRPAKTSVATAAPEAAPVGEIAADDPLGGYLDQIDEAFERLESDGGGRSARQSGESDLPPPPTGRPAVDTDRASLDGALDALEGGFDTLSLDNLSEPVDDAVDDVPAPAAGAASPKQSTEATAPGPRPVAPAAPPPVPSVVFEPTALNPAPRAVATPKPVAPDPVEPAPPDPVAPQPLSTPVNVSGPAVTSQPASAQPPSLADAFAALLAAEQGDAGRHRTTAPRARSAAAGAPSEDLIERVTERVIARLSGGAADELVTEVVARVAERLARDRLDRSR